MFFLRRTKILNYKDIFGEYKGGLENQKTIDQLGVDLRRIFKYFFETHQNTILLNRIFRVGEYKSWLEKTIDYLDSDFVSLDTEIVVEEDVEVIIIPNKLTQSQLN